MRYADWLGDIESESIESERNASAGGWIVGPQEWRSSPHPWGHPDMPAVDEEQVRRIVREEIADLLPTNVPDAPPQDLA
jgi:hypothetical protein